MIIRSRPLSFTTARAGAVFALAATAAVLSACSSSDTTSAPVPAPDPGTGHLHGLGVDPADNSVYAAGHLGVFRLTGGKAVRIADHYQDTMGFTITGPRTFLASGHPSPTDPKATSPHLGLIRSTDAGKTWTTLSAQGTADFHSLQCAGTTLYGYDSQSAQLWASTDDGRTWQRRSKAAITDLAATDSDPERLWATTDSGLQRSTDGGRTFQPVPGAQDLAAIDRPTSTLLIALATDGRVLTSPDGTTFTEHGHLPHGAKPTVLTAVNTTRLLAADDADTVYESKDGGRTWNVLHRSQPESEGH
ncbi:F510_1955 family glycosylhydrolase [Streptomyces fildesensis]|uniref:F510_1955 family glycosylhydrolase n=1 Tax=Streptomyces fildesensis TaxID=375757 RepID=UPI0018E03B90|nr:sialidase family protein [Streptomyces fildesensis]